MVNTIFILNEKKVVTKVLTVDGKNTFFDDLFTMDLSTGVESFEFSTNMTDVYEGCYVMFYYHNQYKLFQITEVEQEHKEGKITTSIYAESVCLELLNSVIRPFKGEFNAITFLEYILNGTNWNIGKYSTSLGNKVLNVEVSKTTQIWSLIQSYMSQFGYEINIRVEFNNGRITNHFLDIYAEEELGERTYKRFEYSRNVTNIVKKKDLYDWCTAIVIDSKVSGVNDIVIDLADWKKSSGSDVILAKANNNKYNNGDAYIYGVYSSNANDPNVIVENALAELQRRSVPRFDYECTTVLTYNEYQNVNIGDTVYVVDFTFDPVLTLEARIGNLEISFTDRNSCKCNLTNYKEIKGTDINTVSGIQSVVDKYFPITSDGIQDGAITNGKIDTTYLEEITSDIVSANLIVTEELIAKEITAINGQFETLDVKYATIDNLNSANANIGTLNSDMATIKTLVNGNLTSDNIQSLVLTTDKVTVADAFIKSAMIDTINANKIVGGSLITNNVKICSNDGAMELNGNIMQFKDKEGNVRIQIGKDAQENFTFVLYGADGKGQLINENGITASAIEDGLIVDSMIGEDANINGAKININSVIKGINESDGSEVLSSTKVYLDDESQSLQVAFGQLKTKVDTIEQVTIDGDLSSIVEQVTTNTTNIEIMQGEINGLISNTTITKENGAVVQLKDEFNSTKNTVDSHTQTISNMTTNYNTLNGTVSDLSSKTSKLEQDLDGFQTSVTSSYYNKTQTDTMINGVNKQVEILEEKVNSVESTMTEEGITNIVKQTTYTKSEIDGSISEVSSSISSEVEQAVDKVMFKFQESGGYNLLYNGDFRRNLEMWSVTSGFSYSFGQGTYSSSDKCGIALVGKSGTSGYLTQSITEKSLLRSPSYTLSGRVYISSSGTNDSGADFQYYIRLGYEDGTYTYHQATIDKTSYNKWQKVSVTASRSTSKTLTEIVVTLGIIKSTKTFYLSQAMLEVGTFANNWSPNPNETNDGVTVIDKNGVKVTHSNYNGYTQMKADGFYVNNGTTNVISCTASGLTVQGTIKGSEITSSNMSNADGTFKISADGTITLSRTSTEFMTLNGGSGINSYKDGYRELAIDNGIIGFYGNDYLYSDVTEVIGTLGRGWIGKHSTTNKNVYSIGLVANTGHSLRFSATYPYDGTYRQDYIEINSEWFLPATTEIQGVVIKNPNLMETITLRHGIYLSGQYAFDDESPSYIMALEEDDGRLQSNTTSLGLFGGKNLYLGFAGELTDFLLVGSYSGSNMYLNCYGDLNMNGKSITNATMTSSLKAQSISTYSLYSSGSIEMNTYVPYTFTENEIRYVEREPQHTMEDEGKYVCYCEIPIFMAENMENNYHINICPLSFGSYRILEKNPYFFIVESENDGFGFTYEVVGKQIEKASVDNSIIANTSVTNTIQEKVDYEKSKMNSAI